MICDWSQVSWFIRAIFDHFQNSTFLLDENINDEYVDEVRTLFVSGLPSDVKQRELHLLFRSYKGNLTSVVQNWNFCRIRKCSPEISTETGQNISNCSGCFRNLWAKSSCTGRNYCWMHKLILSRRPLTGYMEKSSILICRLRWGSSLQSLIQRTGWNH